MSMEKTYYLMPFIQYLLYICLYIGKLTSTIKIMKNTGTQKVMRKMCQRPYFRETDAELKKDYLEVKVES